MPLSTLIFRQNAGKLNYLETEGRVGRTRGLKRQEIHVSRDCFLDRFAPRRHFIRSILLECMAMLC
jgi:hypothetical protein